MVIRVPSYGFLRSTLRLYHFIVLRHMTHQVPLEITNLNIIISSDMISPDITFLSDLISNQINFYMAIIFLVQIFEVNSFRITQMKSYYLYKQNGMLK